MTGFDHRHAARNAEAQRLIDLSWAAGRGGDAVSAALANYRRDPNDAESKVMLVSTIGEFPASVAPDMRNDVLRLLTDEGVSPDYLSVAGWVLLMREPWWNAGLDETQCALLAERLESDELARTLLNEAPVHYRDAERALTRLRKWLLVSGEWRKYRPLTECLAAQAALNSAAWPFGEDERALLAIEDNAPIALAFVPSRAAIHEPDFANPITRAVAAYYERYPYPAWRRLMRTGVKNTLPEQVRALDPTGPDCLPVKANILIAGCGTGSEAAQYALEYPDANITAIDVSEASLAYAKRRCAEIGLDRIRFHKCDINDVASLKMQFDFISSSGVIHHLADPEAGWAKLAGTLRAGGVMRIMLYSPAARRWIDEAREQIRDLYELPTDDDLLRRVRQRFLERDDPLARKVSEQNEFSTLSGTHDVLMHRLENNFDIPRIARALDMLKFKLIAFILPAPDARARYDSMFPQDPMHRNIRAWAAFERYAPETFVSQYIFWCRKEAFWFR